MREGLRKRKWKAHWYNAQCEYNLMVVKSETVTRGRDFGVDMYIAVFEGLHSVATLRSPVQDVLLAGVATSALSLHTEHVAQFTILDYAILIKDALCMRTPAMMTLTSEMCFILR